MVETVLVAEVVCAGASDHGEWRSRCCWDRECCPPAGGVDLHYAIECTNGIMLSLWRQRSCLYRWGQDIWWLGSMHQATRGGREHERIAVGKGVRVAPW